MSKDQKPIARAPERASRTLPPGYRVLHVQVPEEIFNGAKANALLFGIEWPEFVIQILSEAALSKDDFPFKGDRTAPSAN